MRYLLIAVVLSVLAGCATAGSSGKPRVFYDRKYNTYYELRADRRDAKTGLEGATADESPCVRAPRP